MSETWQSYAKDQRTACRYGTKCYSKDFNHQRKFKHPPKNFKRKNGDALNYNKRPKPNTEDQRSAVDEQDLNEPQTSATDAAEIKKTTPERPKQGLANVNNTVDLPENHDEQEASEVWQSYASDPRTECWYGPKCYSKKNEHLKTFKHPPNNLKQKNGAGHHQHNKHPKDNAEDVRPKVESKAHTSVKENTESKPLITKPEKPKQVVPHTNKTVDLQDNLTYHDKHADTSLVKELFLLEMPLDFYKFFECLQTEECMEKTLSSVNLQLIGPFELLLGKLPVVDKELYLVHWRFFYDPPEFQAIIKTKGKSELHMGYYRDSPDEKPVFVASNDSAKDCHITPMAENIFGAVYSHLQNEKKKSPFLAMTCQKVMDKVKKWAEQTGFSLEEYSMKKRQSQVVTKTHHGAGIVVPYDKKTQLGYRKLVETDVAIKKMFGKLKSATTQFEKDKVLSELQPVITYASIAVDECDFGTGLEVGIALFCSGIKELEPSAMSSLCSAYMLLNRGVFAKIFEAHLKYRRRGPDMSLLSIK